MLMRALISIFLLSLAVCSQSVPPRDIVGPGVSHELAKWRAARYSDVRYKLNLTLEKMSPVLKGTIEIRVKVSPGAQAPSPASPLGGEITPIILDWRKLNGHEEKSTISNVTLNGTALSVSPLLTRGLSQPAAQIGDKSAEARASARAIAGTATYDERDEHLVFRDGVVAGENVIKLDFTSPIVTSGSAITRYIDKEDGSEYIYSLFVPSDASTAFPVFDQPDLKARFSLSMTLPTSWRAIANAPLIDETKTWYKRILGNTVLSMRAQMEGTYSADYGETEPISTYVFAFAAGPWERVGSPHVSKGSTQSGSNVEPSLTVGLPTPETSIYVRKSQAAKFRPHAAEVFRLNREAVKFFEQYFDYKFPFPKYDLVLIPEFPFGGMEHAGATFLRESAIIFPQEPTKSDHISRALLIFHEASHQWFGDTVTMRWFDDLWLKEGFATFTAYKALEKIMPEMNAWKVFYERVKQAAYQTDSTKGTTAIYQPIANLSAAKSAYGNIVYNKAPAFLRQAEFYLGEDKFQTAVRAFLKKNEFKNAGWEDLVKEFEKPCDCSLKEWSTQWVKAPGLTRISNPSMPRRSVATVVGEKALESEYLYWIEFAENHNSDFWPMNTKALFILKNGTREAVDLEFQDYALNPAFLPTAEEENVEFTFGNYQDYGYGIFLLDEKSREYVLKNIQNEKDPFLRSMMWGALWDSVREGELDPRVYVELVIKQLGGEVAKMRASARAIAKDGLTETDETIVAMLIGRVSLALNYYLPTSDIALADARIFATSELRSRFEDVLLDGMRKAPTAGQRITFYRAFVNNAASDRARGVLKDLLNLKFQMSDLKLKTKDKFDIVTRLLILGDPEAPKLLAELEKTETSDDAKRYAYAARAGIATPENKAKYWNDFVNNKEISESWIEAAFGPWNSIRHSELTLPYLQKALQELPNHKRSRKIFFVNGWLAAFIGGQRDQKALDVINKFLTDNPNLDKDLRLKILENVDLIERAVKIRIKFAA